MCFIGPVWFYLHCEFSDIQRILINSKRSDVSLSQFDVFFGEYTLTENVSKKIYKKWLVQRYYHLAPSNKVMNLLKNLRKKYQIGLVTNGTSSAQWEKIDKLNIRNLFDTILVSGDLFYEKPDKRIFWRACEELDVHPKHCLMVGDKLETDILGGLEAQLGATVWLPLKSSSSNRTAPDPAPDYVIDDVMDLSWLIDDDKRTNHIFYPEEDCCSNGSDGR